MLINFRLKQNQFNMSQLGKSTPKMRRAFTPRVKSAINIHNTEPKKALYFTDNKVQLNPSFNPQSIELQISKKLNLNSNPSKIGKIDIANLNTDSGSPTKQNPNFSNARISKASEFPLNKGKDMGRNVQWPSNQRKNQNFNQKQSINQDKISRCMSAHTIRSTQSSKCQKSNRIKQNRKQFEEKFNVVLDYLITSNSEYLNEKMSLCNQKARPKQKILTIKRPSINTTNKDFFKKNSDKHKLQIEPQNQKMSLLMSSSKICGNSTTHEFHNGSSQKKADLAQWSQGFKLQGPIYQATTYSNAYPHHGDYQKMVPIAVWNEHPLGMKHIANSSNSRHFKGQFRSRSELATWNNLNPVANDLFDPKKSTMYESQYGKKERQPVQKWPLPQHQLIVTEGKFNTQMKSSLTNFNSHELHTENKCNCGRKKH